MTVIKTYEPNGKTPKGQPVMPAQMIGRNGEAHEVQLDLAGLRKALAESNGVGIFHVMLPDADEQTKVIVSGRKKDEGSKLLTHLTLREVSDSDRVVARIQPAVTDMPSVAQDGKAIIVRPTPGIRVKATVGALEQPLNVDLSGLKVGDEVKAGEIDLPHEIELVSDADEVLFKVQRAESERP